MNYDFELYPFQKQSKDHVLNNEHVLVTAHTGSGKSVIAEIAIYNATVIYNKKCIYTSPIKSLSNQKYNEFKKKFNNVGIITGDVKINPNADVIIATTEILRNSLLAGNNNQYDGILIDNVQCVIFDEVHYISDPDRGSVWEECLFKLPNNIQLIMLSATVSNPTYFVNWLSKIKKKQIQYVTTEKRIVPLTHFIYTNNAFNKLDSENIDVAKKEYMRNNHNKNKILFSCINKLIDQQQYPAIIFNFSRKKCEALAQQTSGCIIYQKYEDDMPYEDDISYEDDMSYKSIVDINSIDHILTKYIECKSEYNNITNSNKYIQLKNMLFKGIGYHHAGMIPILKEIIEILFQQKLIHILFATETFAVGVNMPAKTVVFTQLTKPVNNSINQRILTCSEFTQMSGRAGRLGIDTFGTVIILFMYDYYTNNDISSLLSGKYMAIKSNLNIDYVMVANILNKGECSDILTNSLRYCENVDNIKQYIDHKNKYDDELVNINYSENDFDNEFINTLHDYNKIIELEREYNDMGLKLSSKLQKKINSDKHKFEKNNIFHNKYKKYDKYLQINNKITELNNFIDNEQNEVIKQFNDYEQLLIKTGYVNTIKGRALISLSNTINNIFIVEIISNNVIDNMDNDEILSILTMLSTNKQNINNVTHNNVTHNSNNIHIDNIADKFIEMGKTFNIHNDTWEYNTCNVKHVLNWSNNEPVDFCAIYEGDFIKVVLKIIAIINDFILGYNIFNMHYMIERMEYIKCSIDKDIMSIKSLYIDM